MYKRHSWVMVLASLTGGSPKLNVFLKVCMRHLGFSSKMREGLLTHTGQKYVKSAYQM